MDNNDSELKKQEEQESLEKAGSIAARGALDYATGGKWEKVRNAPVIGKAARKVEGKAGKKLTRGPMKGTKAKIAKKADDAGALDAVSKGLDAYGGAANSKGAGKNDVGSNKLRNSLANRKKNLPKKNSSASDDASKNNNNGDSSAKEENKEDNSLNKSGGIISKKLKIKIILWASAGVFLILFIMIVIIAISGGNAVFGSPFASYLSYGSNEFQAISDKNSPQYQQEIEFYKKINQLKTDYQKKCGDDLKVNYIYASLIYYFYTVDTSNKQANEGTLFIDYGKMNKMIDHVASLMYTNDSCEIDVELKGSFYNNLKNDSEFRNYYSELLKTKSMDEILEDIFSLGEMIDISSDTADTFVSEDIRVNVSNVKSSSSSTSSSSGGSSGSGNNSSSSGSKNNVTNKSNTLNVTLKEYLLGITYASIKNDADINNSEKIKAYVIANLTNLAAKSNLTNNTITINISSDSDTLYCNPNTGCSYTKVNGKKILQESSGKREDGNNVFYGGKYYYLPPNTTAMVNINNAINVVYGYVLVNNSGKSEMVDATKIVGVTANNYQNILSIAYPNLKIKNIGENTYTNSVNYGNKYVLTKVIFYDQKDYSNYYFCHRTGKLAKNSIGYAGCGITATAIVVSTYENSKKYDPIYMNERAYTTGNCGKSDGTYTGFYGTEAKKMGYKYLNVGKKKTSDLNLVLSHLSEGHLVIVHVGKGIFTGSGHYMVIGGLDSASKKVYIYDPNNRANKANRNTGSGWYSFNELVKQVKSFYIMWKG